MEKNKKTALTYYIIGSALIWAATTLGCAFILKGSFNQVSLLITSAATMHLIIIWGPLSAQFKKQGAAQCCKQE
ncbi:hypothetical protein GCM10027049_02910 [Mucilaginibacter puniceus]